MGEKYEQDFACMFFSVGARVRVRILYLYVYALAQFEHIFWGSY